MTQTAPNHLAIAVLGLLLTASIAQAQEPALPEGPKPDKKTPTKAKPGTKSPAKAKPAKRDDARLKPITVSAGRRGETQAFDEPGSIDVVTERQITSGAIPRSISEALGQLPSVSGQETSRGQGSPYIRGLTGFHNLILIDGIRLNNSVFRFGPNQYLSTVDPLLANRIEVIRGSNSLLYGSSALGGVIRIESKRPTLGKSREADGYLPTIDDIRLRGRLFHRFSTADISTMTRAEFAAEGEKNGLLVGASYLDAKDLRGGANTGKMSNTSYSAYAFDMKFIHAIQEKTRVIAAFQRNEQRAVPRTHSTRFSKSFKGSSIGTDLRRDLNQSRQLAYLQLETEKKGPFETAKVSISWNRQYQIEQRLRQNRNATRRGFEVNTLGSFIELSSRLPADIILRTGADIQHDFVDSFASSFNAGAQTFTRSPRGDIADDAQYTLFGTYIALELPIGELITVNGGVRYEFANINANDVDPNPSDNVRNRKLDRNFDGLIGSGGITLHINDSLNLIANLIQGFRTPNLNDTTAFRPVGSTAFDIPARNVDPERTLTYELGVKFESRRWGRLQAFIYRTEIDNFIQRIPTGQVINGQTVFSKDNVSDGRIFGAEGGGEIFVLTEPRLSLFGGASWTQGFAKALKNGAFRNEPISRINPTQGRLGLRWRSKDARYSAEVEYLVVRHQHRLAPSDVTDRQRIPPPGTPGYSLWSLRGSAELVRNCRLSISLENLGDVDYRVHGSGQNGPGFNAVAGLDWKF